jgi:hypothetical protein
LWKCVRGTYSNEMDGFNRLEIEIDSQIRCSVAVYS